MHPAPVGFKRINCDISPHQVSDAVIPLSTVQANPRSPTQEQHASGFRAFCGVIIKSLENNLKFGNDLGDTSILNVYKEDRLPKTIAMTAITDFLFYGFTSKSKKTQALLTKGMETLNQSDLKNIFKDIASN